MKIDINTIAKNLVEAAISEVELRQTPNGRNITDDSSREANADQLYLKAGHRLKKISNKAQATEQELDKLGNQIAAISKNMSDEEVDAAVNDKDSELYKLTDRYNEIETQLRSLEKQNAELDNLRASFYDRSGDSISRKALADYMKNDPEIYNQYRYDKAIEHLKQLLANKYNIHDEEMLHQFIRSQYESVEESDEMEEMARGVMAPQEYAKRAYNNNHQEQPFSTADGFMKNVIMNVDNPEHEKYTDLMGQYIKDMDSSSYSDIAHDAGTEEDLKKSNEEIAMFYADNVLNHRKNMKTAYRQSNGAINAYGNNVKDRKLDRPDLGTPVPEEK